MNTQTEIEKWKRILDKDISGPNHSTARDRLRAYICSFALGRNFGESADVYIERAGYAPFVEWATDTLSGKNDKKGTF